MQVLKKLISYKIPQWKITDKLLRLIINLNLPIHSDQSNNGHLNLVVHTSDTQKGMEFLDPDNDNSFHSRCISNNLKMENNPI